MCIDIGSVSAGIDPIPPVHWQKNRIETVQAERSGFAIDGQALIAQTGWNTVCSQQRCQKMTLRIAIATTDPQDLGGSAGNGLEAVIAAVLDLIADSFGAALSNEHSILSARRQRPSERQHLRMLPIDNVRGTQKMVHMWFL